MRFTQFLLRGVLCLAALAGLLGAQSVAVLTGASGTSTTIPLYSADPNSTSLTSAGTISPVPAGAFQLLSAPDGTKYYVISNIVGGISSVPVSLGSPTQIATAIPLAPYKAALSGDGKRLIVLTTTSSASSAYLIDTATNTLINPSGFGLTGTAVDVAVSLDSTTAFVLTYVNTGGGSGVISSTSGTAYVTPINLSVNTVGTALTVNTSGSATGLAAAPNGLLYLTVQNGLIEMSPKPLQLTTNSTIQVNGLPGKVQFTTDSNTAIALNLTPSTGAAMVFDLVNRRVTLASNGNLNGATLDHLVVARDSRIFAYSSTSRTMFELSLGGGFNETSLKSVNVALAESVVSVLPSNEVPAKTLYVAAAPSSVTTLYKVDLSSSSVLAQQAIASQSGEQLAWTGANPTTGGAAISGFNIAQTIASGGTSLPLVARVLDSLGRPVFGATVTFVANNGTTFSGTSSSSVSAYTSADGFAEVYAVVGTATSTVTASSTNTSNVTYTLTVPGSTGGCTSNCGTASAVTIVRGNGQVQFEQNLLFEPLEVRVVDGNGNGVANAPLVFSVSSGNGSLGCPYTTDYSNLPASVCSFDASNSGALDLTTDANGYAAVKFVTSSTGGNNQSWVNTTVQATGTAGTATFTEITVLRVTNQGTTGALPSVTLVAPQFDSRGYRSITGTAGQTIAAAIQVQVTASVGIEQGAPIPGIALNVSGIGDATKNPSATCVGGTPYTDSTGVATCNLLLGPVTTSYPTQINVDVGSAIVPSTIVIVVNPGLPDTITVVSGNGVSGNPGGTVALKAIVKNSDGTLSTGTALTWSVNPSSYATLSNSFTVTDSTGAAQATLNLGSTPGQVRVTLTAGSGSTAASTTFTVTIVAVAPSVGGISAVSGSGQTATILTAFANPLVVKVTDSGGAALSGATVTFRATSGSATFTTPAATDSNGQTSTIVTAGGTAGTITVTATVSTFSTQFTLTATATGPSIDANSFQNGAWPGNFAAYGLKPGLSPCGVAIVSGTGLATGVQGTVVGNSFFGALPTSLAGVILTVNGIPAPLYWVSNTASGEAVAFQTPCQAAPGTATVVVTVGSVTKTVTGVSVVAFQPGIFETTYNNVDYAVLLHAKDGSYVDPATNPAHAGETLTMFTTGLGPVTPATATNAAGIGQTPTAIITVGVNNGGVAVTGAEYLPGAIGLYTINFQIPAGTPAGRLPLGLIVADPANPNVPIYAKGSFVPVQ